MQGHEGKATKRQRRGYDSGATGPCKIRRLCVKKHSGYEHWEHEEFQPSFFLFFFFSSLIPYPVLFREKKKKRKRDETFGKFLDDT